MSGLENNLVSQISETILNVHRVHRRFRLTVIFHPRRPRGSLWGQRKNSRSKSTKEKSLIFLSYFCSSIFFVFGPTNCPWVSKDGTFILKLIISLVVTSITILVKCMFVPWLSASPLQGHSF